MAEEWHGERKSEDRIYWLNKYGVRLATQMTDDILTSILDYSQAIVDESHDIANDIQKQMLNKITRITPVRDYSTHTQEVSRIIVHRHEPDVPMAVRERKADKYQPGTTKDSWRRLTTSSLGKAEYSIAHSRVGYTTREKSQTRTIYAIRNVTRWSIIHLLNFKHDTVAHEVRYLESAKGSNFVTDVQNWGRQELDRRLKEYFDAK